MEKKGKPAGSTVAVCRALAQPVADELGLMLWDVRFVKEGTMWYLRFIIDKEDGVTIDDCVAMSRRMNTILDEADPISQSYCMEVESPGIERELIQPEHFEAFLGYPIQIRTIRPIDGVRDFAGILTAYRDGVVCIEEEDGTPREFVKKETASVRLIEEWE